DETLALPQTGGRVFLRLGEVDPNAKMGHSPAVGDRPELRVSGQFTNHHQLVKRRHGALSCTRLGSLRKPPTCVRFRHVMLLYIRLPWQTRLAGIPSAFFPGAR